jgi:membrane protease YdiL (CAAX protease family)
MRVDSAERTSLSPQERGLSFLEFALGALIIIGHNVFHILPNEVPILVVLGLVSIRLREGSWRAIGLGRPKSWWRTIAIAFAAALLVLAAGQCVTEPLAKAVGLQTNAGAAANALGGMKGDAWNTLKGLAIVWTFAAFGEEIGYRRYLLGRAADAGNRSPFAYWFGLLAVSVLFGFGHYYQGPAGVFTTACDGFMIGAAYLLSRRNLWVAILTHGLIDTIGIGLLFFGFAD